MHTTLYSIAESPRDPRVIWVGTDDGNLQLTRDAGQRWSNVVSHVPGLPQGSWVSWVEASPFAAGTAYAAFDRHTFGDMAPWIFKTTDYGASWRRIASPEQGMRGYVHVIRQDRRSPGLLYAGTELGLYVSLNDGGSWSRLEGGEFPAVAVRDLQLQTRDDDLVIATHGRGIWILDDLAALRALGSELLQQPAAFLPGRPTQQRLPTLGGWPEGDAAYSGQNPPAGAVISYYLRSRHIYGPLKLEILDAAGKLVDSVDPGKRPGVNRVVWNMREKPPRVPRAATVAFGASQGPRVLPGKYRVRLTRGAEVIETRLSVGLDRRAPFNEQDRRSQRAALTQAGALFGRMTDLTERIDGLRAALTRQRPALPAQDALALQLKAAGDKLDAIKKEVVATTEGGAITGEERIREHLDELFSAWNGWEGRPTPYQLERLAALTRELDDVHARFERFGKDELPALDQALRQRQLAPLGALAPAPSALAIACVLSKGERCRGQRAAAAENDR